MVIASGKMAAEMCVRGGNQNVLVYLDICLGSIQFNSIESSRVEQLNQLSFRLLPAGLYFSAQSLLCFLAKLIISFISLVSAERSAPARYLLSSFVVVVVAIVGGGVGVTNTVFVVDNVSLPVAFDTNFIRKSTSSTWWGCLWASSFSSFALSFWRLFLMCDKRSLCEAGLFASPSSFR